MRAPAKPAVDVDERRALPAPELEVGDDERARPLVPPWVWPLAIGVVAVLLRVWHLDRVGFNSDETVYSGQAAAIAGNTELSRFFPVFRAHPLLFQGLLSLVYRVHISDLLGRLVSVVFGLGTVVIGYRAGRTLYGRRAGLVAAALLAVMPYLVVVDRQVLLDGPMVFFATLALACAARFGVTRDPAWLYATSAALGLTFLTKETGAVLVVSVYAFVALTPALRVRVRDVATSLGILLALALVFPTAVLASRHTRTGEQFFVWQLLRRPNHGMGFYLDHVPAAIGFVVLAIALLGLWLLRRDGSWRETLLLAWIGFPVVFFQLWPVKGFQYLLPIAPAVAILAARALATIPTGGYVRLFRRVVPSRLMAVGVALFVGVTLVVPTWAAIDQQAENALLAGSGGTPGGRETGRWMRAQVPEGVQILAIGPSMANIVQYYGHRKSYGLSVSPNPLHRNPVYEPVHNPDKLIRRGDLQYLVWDSFSAHRSPVFSHTLLRLVAKYHGRVVHEERAGRRRPVVVVYLVRGSV